MSWIRSGQPEKAAKTLILELNSDNTEGKQQFKVKDSLRVYMYVSEPPCGDASLLEVTGEQGGRMHWTGAKPLLKEQRTSEYTPAQYEGCAKIEKGICRLKCARSDIPDD